MASFDKMELSPEILKNLESLDFHQMTEVQEKSLPLILKGRDVAVQAKTGSGKTIAFGLGLVAKIDHSKKLPTSLVLCPTRELAAQVAGELRKLARMIKDVKILSLCGGTPIRSQMSSLEFGANIIVGTPGRILDHLEKHSLSLRDIQQIVLDEADRMLDMGFSEDIREIFSYAKKPKQTMLFSATYPDDIKELSRGIQNDAKLIKAQTEKINLDIKQVFYRTQASERQQLLLDILAKHQPESTIIFCTTKIQCDEIADMLQKRGLRAHALHGGLEQYDRDEIMVLFTHKSISAIVATDVAARGLDVEDLDLVVNFELSKDPEIHVHRTGRTGRAGKKGMAISLVSGSKEAFRLENISEYLDQKLSIEKFVKDPDASVRYLPPMRTIKISGGKKNKIRPGDILGALVKDMGIHSKAIGKITVFDFYAYVALDSAIAESKLQSPKDIKIKNKMLRARMV